MIEAARYTDPANEAGRCRAPQGSRRADVADDDITRRWRSWPVNISDRHARDFLQARERIVERGRRADAFVCSAFVLTIDIDIWLA